MNLKIVAPQKCVFCHFVNKEAVKSKDDMVRSFSLWFVDAGISAVKKVANECVIVNVKVHDVEFITGVEEGEHLSFESMAVHTGNATVTTYIVCYSLERQNLRVAQGFASFVLMDGNGSVCHNRCAIEPQTDDEWRLFNRVCSFSIRKHLMKSNLRYVRPTSPRKL
ncbi:MAG: hypothetical protein WCU80_07630 [Paludibacteraceae bacterium]